MGEPLEAVCAGRPRPLDYRPIEQFLDNADQRLRKRIEKELEPAAPTCRPRGPTCRKRCERSRATHAVVRWPAALLLGERGLGQGLAQKILPALAARLSDSHSTARRLAVLSISYWKAAAKPYRGAIEALRDDPDETVRRIVDHVLGNG